MSDQHGDFTERTEEIHLADYIRVVRKRLGLLILTALLVSAAGVTYVFLAKPVYRAEIKLEIIDTPEKEISVISSLSGLGKDKVETEIEKIRSRDIARTVVENLKLQNSYTAESGSPDLKVTDISCPGVQRFEPSRYTVNVSKDGTSAFVLDGNGSVLGPVENGAFSSPEISFRIRGMETVHGDVIEITCQHVETCVEQLMKRTSVFRLGETSIIGISVEDLSPVAAKTIVDEYYYVYSNRNLEEKNAAAREVNKFISERKTFYNKKLLEASHDLQTFKEQHNIYSLNSQNAALIDQMASLETTRALKKVELDRVGNAASQVADDTREFSTPEIFAPQSALEQLSAKLSMLQVERKTLLNNLTPDHPRVRDVDVQISEIKKSIIEKLDSTRKILEGEIASIEKQIAQYNKQVQSLPRLDKELVVKMRDVKFYEEMDLQMATKSEEFSIVEVSTLSSIRIVQNPIVPVEPVRPKKMVNIILSLIIGSVAGLGAAFLREYFDHTFVSTEEVEEFMDDPVLITVPFVRKRFSRDISVNKEDGVAYLSADSPVTEAFRTLKTSLEFLEIGKAHKIYQITSSIASEGKSTVSTNLAITFANSGHKTLLIDGDYKKPVLNGILGCENTVGFVDMIFKNANPSEMIQETNVENLSFISSGHGSIGAMPSLDVMKLERVLHNLQEEYDYVFVDTPPVLAVDDTIRVGKIVSGVIIVTALGKVDRRLAQRCLTRCKQSNVHICGIVVNDCTASSKYGRGYSYYQYYQHYSSETRDSRKSEIEKKWRISI